MLLVVMVDRRYVVLHFSVPVLEKGQAWLTYWEGFFDGQRCNFPVFRISSIFKCYGNGDLVPKVTKPVYMEFITVCNRIIQVMVSLLAPIARWAETNKQKYRWQRYGHQRLLIE